MNLTLVYEDVSITPITNTDIEFLRVMRNNPAVRKYLLTDKEVSREQQESWYATYQNDPTQLRFLIKKGIEPVGMTSITDIVDSNVRQGESGIVLAEEFFGRKIGTKATELLYHYAFKLAGFTILVGTIHQENKASLALAQKTHDIPISRDEFSRQGFVPAEWPYVFYKAVAGRESVQGIKVESNFPVSDLSLFPK